MPKSNTTNLGLNMFEDGDNPGAGLTNSPAPANAGLNGNWYKLDAVVGAVIDGSGNIIANKVTSSSIISGAVTEAKIGTNAVTNVKIADGTIKNNKFHTDAIETNTMNINASGQLQVKSGGINTLQLTDSAVSTAKIIDDAVTSAKISHDNNRTKNTFTFIWNEAVADGYYKHQGVTMTANLGISMPRAGAVTKMTTCDSAGNTGLSSTIPYTPSGATHFAVGDKLTAYSFVSNDGQIQARINGNPVFSFIGVITNPSVCLIEVEFDD